MSIERERAVMHLNLNSVEKGDVIRISLNGKPVESFIIVESEITVTRSLCLTRFPDAAFLSPQD